MWLSLLITVLTFLFSKKKGVSTSKSALAALAAGAGTYYVQTETDWGQTNLMGLDNFMNGVTAATPVVGADGQPVIDPKTGLQLLGPAPTATKSNTGVFSAVGQFLSSKAGTVAALGTGALLGGVSPWLIGGVILFLVVK